MPMSRRSDIQPVTWSDSIITDNRKTVTTAGTAEALMASATKVKWVTIQALRGNTDYVAVGASTVVAADGTERGAVLSPETAITFYGVDLNEIYVDSVVNGEGVSFVYGT